MKNQNNQSDDHLECIKVLTNTSNKLLDELMALNMLEPTLGSDTPKLNLGYSPSMTRDVKWAVHLDKAVYWTLFF